MASPYKFFGITGNTQPGSSYSSGALRPYAAQSPASSGFLSSFAPSSNAVGTLENQPKQLVPSIKSGAQQDRIGQLYEGYDQNKTADTSSLADFTKNYLSSDPAAKAATAQETGAIGGYYDGGIGSHLDLLANNARQAANEAAQRAIGAAGRQSALWRMAHGNSSYADAQMADTYAGIANQNAQQDAARRLANYQTVLQGQQANLGVRNKLQDAYLNRMLVPGQVRQDLFNRQAGNLGTLSGLDLSNTDYSMPTYSPYMPPPVRSPVMSASDSYWMNHPSTPQGTLTLRANPLDPGGLVSNQIPTPVIPSFDSYGRPQAPPTPPGVVPLPRPSPFNLNGPFITPDYSGNIPWPNPRLI